MTPPRGPAPPPTTKPVVIHYALRFDGGPKFCGYGRIPMPASSEWRYVSCRACIEKRERVRFR